MCEFKGIIPAAPPSANFTYSHPYLKPKYNLMNLKINYNDFPIEEKNDQNNQSSDQIRKKKLELEQKISKIKELTKLKSTEKLLKEGKLILNEREKMDKSIDTISQSFANIAGYAASLSERLLCYDKNQSNKLFEDLIQIFSEKDVTLTGDNNNLRCEKINQIFNSLQ